MTTDKMRLWQEGKSFMALLAQKGIVTLKPSPYAIGLIARELDLNNAYVKKCIDIFNFEN